MGNGNQLDKSDPRIYFAAERTLLAWLRTGLAVIGIGFLVARFGLFLQMLRHPGAEISPPLVSSLIGIGFVLLGATLVASSAWHHAKFIRELDLAALPPSYNTKFAIIVSAIVAGLGIALAIFLIVSVFIENRPPAN